MCKSEMEVSIFYSLNMCSNCNYVEPLTEEQRKNIKIAKANNNAEMHGHYGVDFETPVLDECECNLSDPEDDETYYEITTDCDIDGVFTVQKICAFCNKALDDPYKDI